MSIWHHCKCRAFCAKNQINNWASAKTNGKIDQVIGRKKETDRLIEEKKNILCSESNKKKIGIFWQGNPTILFNRSVKLNYFLFF